MRISFLALTLLVAVSAMAAESTFPTDAEIRKILADPAQRGEVALTDTVPTYLPPEVKMPSHRRKKIE